MRLLRYTATLIFCIVSGSVLAQGFHPPITNYSPRDYGKDFTPENWAITQDFRGVIYSGNGNGVLEYDGTSWNFIEVKPGAYSVSLATDSSGTVFVGSIGEFGFLAPDEKGQMTFHSLLGLLPEEDQFFGVVWNTWATKELVYFQTEEQLMVYDYNSVHVIRPESQFHTSYVVDGELYIRDKGRGLLRLEDDTPESIYGDTIFAGYGVFGVYSIDKGQGSIPDQPGLFVVTQEIGLWELYQDTAIHVKTPDSTEIKDALIFNSMELSDGNIGLGTSFGGLLVIDRKGRIVKRVNKASGLRVNDVKDVFEDKDNNLWLALNNGISKVNYNSPLSFFSEESGIIGGVEAVYRFNGQLYVGTSSGLFTENPDGESFREFAPLGKIHWQVWAFEEINGRLVIGTSEGLYRLQGNRPVEVMDKNVNAISYLEDEGLIVTAGADGIYFMDESFNVVEALDAPNTGAMGIARSPDPLYGDIELWVGLFAEGVIRINLENGEYNYEQYDSFDGLNEGQWTKPMQLNDELVFGTSTGLMHFIDEKEVRKGLPDSLKNDPEFARGYFDTYPLYDSTYQVPLNLLAQSTDRTWASIDFQIVYFDRANNDTIIRHPFWGINYGRINHFYLEENGALWIGAADGLIRYEKNPSKEYNRSFKAIIRSVAANSDSTLFSGTYFRKRDTVNIVAFGQPESLVPELDYEYNSIRFSFAAPYFEDNHKVQFSYKLEGHDEEWSEWSYKPEANYTNLKEGDYIFRVKAKSVYEQESEIAEYRFSIAPPWYRTTWAFAGYGVGALLLIFIAIRIGLYRLRKKNEYLEKVVAERTQEIKEKNVTLEHQRDEILHQKTEIMDSINYAKRIQDAILPIDEEIQRNLKENFVLFKPKDIVSGDFYWFARVGDDNVLVCADCTGHGVPGAFMSMIGSDKLNQVVKERKITDPSIILAEVNRGIKKALKQSGEGATRDGMDVSIVNINYKKGKLQYAGAHRPLWVVSSYGTEDVFGLGSSLTSDRTEDGSGSGSSLSSDRSEDGSGSGSSPLSSDKSEDVPPKGGNSTARLHEVKATKVAVGGFTEDDQEFELHELDLREGDRYYMCSDGYADQFGGERGKKLKIKTMKQLILEIADRPMSEQGKFLDDRLMEWMGDYEQLDDVCVIGVRV